MIQGGIHQDFARAHHAEMVRRARENELAATVATSRRHERRTFLAHLWRKRFEPADPQAATTRPAAHTG